SFTVLGHLQLAREARGGGVDDAAWDEWYCSFSDGTWGWLAGGQGGLYLTPPLDGREPGFPFEALSAGQRIDEPGLGILAVEAVGTSRFGVARCELAVTPALVS